MRMASLLAVLALCGLPQFAVARTLYQSDFAKVPDGPAALSDWSLDGADYRLADGWLTVKSEKSNPYARLKVAHDGDFTFRATVRNAPGCHWSGLLGRGVYRLEVNNQFVKLRLMRLVGTDWKVVGDAGDYAQYARNTQQFELRLVAVGNHITGFLDDKKLVEYTDPDPVPPAGDFALMGGWGSNVAWRDLSLTDRPDLHEWPYETLPKATGREVVEVTQVRGLSDQMPFDNIYFDGDTAGLKIRLKAARPSFAQAALRFRLIDVRGQQVAVQAQQVALKPDADTEVTARFPATRRGCFKVALDAGLTPATLGWVEDLGSFTVVARELNDRPRNRNSYFGGHMDGIYLAWHLSVGRKLGIQWARCHDMMQWTWWDRIQPDSGDQWKWNDEAQKTVDDIGHATQGEFLWVPKWAQRQGVAGNPATYPPRDMADFARYVYNTVSHYKGSIKTWEVWNEPHYSGFFSGTPVEYAALLKIAYAECKRADPECIVLGGGGVNPRSMRWIQQMLAAVDAKCMDGFTIHYLEPDFGPAVIPELRRELAAKGCTGPLINSEETVLSTSFFDQCRATRAEPEARYHYRNACYELVRTYMENLAAGIARVFYYDQCDPWRYKPFPKARVSTPSPVGGSMWDEGQMLKPTAAAHAALALAIDGKPFRGRVTRGALEAFLFTGGDGACTAVQYAVYPSFAHHTSLRLTLPAGARAADFTAMDFMGNPLALKTEGGALVLPLSREPVYVTCKGGGAERILRGMYETAKPAE